MKRKRTLLAGILACLCFGLLGTSCNDEKNVGFSDLPAPARVFIETFFPEMGISSVVREKDDGRKEYIVLLNDGTEIDFNSGGEWQSIDCPFSTLPKGILPGGIDSDIETRFPGSRVYGAEREVGGFKIDLIDASDVAYEVRYSASGDFIGQAIDR